MYSKIDAKFWTDEKIRGISLEGRYLMLYLLTTEHRNILGCYVLSKAYAQDDTEIPAEAFDRAWNELLAADLIRYDETPRVILVRNFLKYNPIENPKQATGAISKLEDMPRSELFVELTNILRGLDKPFLQPLMEALMKRYPKGYAIPFPEPYRKGYAKPDNREQITDNR